MSLVPPLSMWLSVCSEDSRDVRLWLPLFLVWLILLPVLVLALALTLIADTVLFLIGQKYHHYTLLLLRICGVIADARGMAIRIRSANKNVELTFW